MTPAQCLTTIRAQVNETDASFWSDGEIYGYMWEAENEIAQLAKCTETTDATTTTVSGTAEYSLPTNCLYVQRVTWDSFRLKKIDFRELESLEGFSYGHTIGSGSCDSYYLFGNKIGLYPTPNAVKTLKLWYVAQPTAITASSTSFTINQLFHHYIPHYCLWIMWSKDQESGRANFFKAQWERDLQIIPVKWSNYLRSDRISVAKDVDAYPNTDAGMV